MDKSTQKRGGDTDGPRSRPKDAHEDTIRLAPPLVIERFELEWAVEQLAAVLT